MTEHKLLFLDIKANSISSVEETADQPHWTRSENTFKFNFFPGDSSSAAPQQQSPPSDEAGAALSRGSFTGQGTAFAFNFQIPPVAPEEDMMTTEASDCVGEENPAALDDVQSQPETSNTKKKKKKKKSGKKEASDGAEAQQETSSTEGNQQGGKDTTELSAEEQLNRQLDWCIEQLESGMRSQKVTVKQKEEASRALKTLRSSKAPLVKKRQVMRSMTGDYRKKMEEEKSKQFKLIQSELASARVKPVSSSPKKSVFHRRSEVNSQNRVSEEKLQQTEAQESEQKAQEETPAFIFTPSKGEFHFNFF